MNWQKVSPRDNSQLFMTIRVWELNLFLSRRIGVSQRRINISHVLRVLRSDILLQVLRQTTLPIVPTRHQTFQRQLSHRLEIPSTIQFSICSLEHRSETSIVGLIKVRYALVLTSGGGATFVSLVQRRTCRNWFPSTRYQNWKSHDLHEKMLNFLVRTTKFVSWCLYKLRRKCVEICLFSSLSFTKRILCDSHQRTALDQKWNIAANYTLPSDTTRTWKGLSLRLVNSFTNLRHVIYTK